jgi:hypothetical protein
MPVGYREDEPTRVALGGGGRLQTYIAIPYKVRQSKNQLVKTNSVVGYTTEARVTEGLLFPRYFLKRGSFRSAEQFLS